MAAKLNTLLKCLSFLSLSISLAFFYASIKSVPYAGREIEETDRRTDRWNNTSHACMQADRKTDRLKERKTGS
jgi:hypothetical protein